MWTSKENGERRAIVTRPAQQGSSIRKLQIIRICYTGFLLVYVHTRLVIIYISLDVLSHILRASVYTSLFRLIFFVFFLFFFFSYSIRRNALIALFSFVCRVLVFVVSLMIDVDRETKKRNKQCQTEDAQVFKCGKFRRWSGGMTTRNDEKSNGP